MEGNGSNDKKEIFSSAVRAGRRTYFFDVKKTRRGDLYLTVTESKKVFDNKDGSFHFEKHKLFLYKEDFHKFSDALNEAVSFIQDNVENYLEEGSEPSVETNHTTENGIEAATNGFSEEEPVAETSNFTNVDFGDLDNE